MHFKLKLVLESEDGIETVSNDICLLDKPFDRVEHLGISIAESKSILKGIQKTIVDHQMTSYTNRLQNCKSCNKHLRIKQYRNFKVRSLFGDLKINNPIFRSCKCSDSNKTFSPLSALFKDKITPELYFMESKWAALVSYGLTVELLKDSFPIDEKLSIETVRRNTLDISKRMDSLLHNEKYIYTDCTPSLIDKKAFNNESTVLGIDGGYLRSSGNTKKKFELIVGKSTPIVGKDMVFGLVKSVDNKPKRRVYELLKSQNINDSDGVCFMSDGGESLKDLQTYINPNAKHILEWFHITMKITVLNQCVKGLINIDSEKGENIKSVLESIKWKLWHGKPLDALPKILKLSDLSAHFENSYDRYRVLIKYICEFYNYISNNIDIIVNYGSRYKEGKVITTAFVESLVNSLVSKRFCKKQQMQWSKKGAHLLMQIRTAVVNKELQTIFKNWYPDFQTDAINANGFSTMVAA